MFAFQLCEAAKLCLLIALWIAAWCAIIGLDNPTPVIWRGLYGAAGLAGIGALLAAAGGALRLADRRIIVRRIGR